jgi:hypothetical protein
MFAGGNQLSVARNQFLVPGSQFPVIRTCLINSSQGRLPGPQGLKPALLLALSGTAEAVPYPKPFMRPALVFIANTNLLTGVSIVAGVRIRSSNLFVLARCSLFCDSSHITVFPVDDILGGSWESAAFCGKYFWWT